MKFMGVYSLLGSIVFYLATYCDSRTNIAGTSSGGIRGTSGAPDRKQSWDAKLIALRSARQADAICRNRYASALFVFHSAPIVLAIKLCFCKPPSRNVL
jgi:hypothetical protein